MRQRSQRSQHLIQRPSNLQPLLLKHEAAPRVVRTNPKFWQSAWRRIEHLSQYHRRSHRSPRDRRDPKLRQGCRKHHLQLRKRSLPTCSRRYDNSSKIAQTAVETNTQPGFLDHI